MDSIYVKNPDFVQREVAGEFILIPIKRNLQESNDLFVLNEMGTAVWKKIDGARSVAKIQSDLLTEYDVTERQLENDLNSLLEDLRSIDAIQAKAS